MPTTPDLALLSGLEPASVAIVFGTRPEIIKLSGVIQLFGDKASTIFSGQHFDERLADIFFDGLGLARPDVTLSVGGRARGQQIGELVLRLQERFEEHRPAVVVVQGDTNSALGGALAANAAEIPLAHIEAGVRSFDRSMPEEHNRIVIDHLADLCIAPTEQARKNLLGEGIPGERIAVTGNTIVDVATRLLPPKAERARSTERMGIVPGTFALVTFHRPENVDDPVRLATLLRELAGLDLPVVFPVHPRTRDRIEAFGLDSAMGRVSLVDPVDYATFLSLAAECAFLLSDSGGVQEEASVVKRPALILRSACDRPEVLGTFTTLVTDLADLPRAVRDLLDDLADTHRRLARMPTPYGDGLASARCVSRIASLALASS